MAHLKPLRTILPLLVLASACGCIYASSPGGINPHTEVLEEGSFRFRYPIDWKITTEEKTTEQGEKIAAYYFRHPQVRSCMVTIEWIKFPIDSRRFDHTSEIIAEKARLLKKDFSGSGYHDFSFRTSPATFAKQDAVKAVFQAGQSSRQRETIVRIVSYKSDYYAVSYQSFSHWKPDILQRLEDIVRSFEFVR